jgi:hypothetical protein
VSRVYRGGTSKALPARGRPARGRLPPFQAANNAGSNGRRRVLGGAAGLPRGAGRRADRTLSEKRGILPEAGGLPAKYGKNAAKHR